MTRPPRFELLNEMDPHPTPLDRNALLLDAVRHFQSAIVLAKDCDLNTPLLPVQQPQQWIRLVSLPDIEQPANKPMRGLVVLDLVKAIRAENYVDQAQAELEQLLLDPPQITYLRQVAQGDLR